MAKPRAEYEISAKDESKKGIKSAQGGLKGLSKSAGVAFKSVAKAATIATAAVSAVAFGVSKLVDKFAEQEKAEIKLAAASRNNPLINGDGVKSLIDYSAALQKVSIFGDELLIGQASFLTTLQLSEDQIKNVLAAATDLASTGMMSLDSAVKNIAKTYGGMAGELGELIPQLRTLTTEQLKNGEAVDLISKNYEGMAEAVANSTAGIKEQTANLFGDMAEKVGEAFAPIQNTILKAVQPAFNRIIKWFTDNQKPITNFFLHFGEIAMMTMGRIGEGFIKMFSWKHAWESIKAFASYMYTTWKNTFKTIWAITKAIGNTIWVPLSNGFQYVLYGLKVGWTTTMNILKKGLLWFIDGPVDMLGNAFRSVVGGIGDSISWILNGLVSLINTVLTGLNKMNESAHNVQQAIMHPFDKSKREEYQGGDLVKPLGMNFDFEWMKGQNKKLSERIGGLTEALDPKDISLIKNNAQSFEDALATIGDGWKEAGDQSVEAYVDNMKAALEMNKSIFADPFIDAFDDFGAEFKGVLMKDLDPTATAIADALEDGSKKVIKKLAMEFYPMYKKTFWDYIGGVLKDIGGWFKDAKASLSEGGEYEKVGAALSSVGATAMAFGKYLLDGLMATEAFTGAMETLNKTIDSVFEALIAPVMRAINPLVNILINFATTIGSILMPLMAAIGNTLVALLPIVSMLGNMLAQILVPIVDVLAIALQIVTDLLVQLTPVFKALFEVVLNVLTPVLEFLGSILTALAPVFQLIGDILLAVAPILEAVGILLGDILGPALQFVADLLSAVLNPVISILADVMLILVPLFKIYATIMKAITPIYSVLFQLISILLIPLQILGTLLTILNPVFELLGNMLTMIIPIIELFGKIIDAVSRPIEFLADVVTWLGNWLSYLGKAVAAAAYNITHPFKHKHSAGRSPGAFKSDAFTRPLIDFSDVKAAEVTTPDFSNINTDISNTNTNTDSGYTPANQYGSNSTTVNVEINTEVVVGEPGLRELALMIDREINSARELGIA